MTTSDEGQRIALTYLMEHHKKTDGITDTYSHDGTLILVTSDDNLSTFLLSVLADLHNGRPLPEVEAYLARKSNQPLSASYN